MWRRLEAVVLSFHAKPEPEWLQGGAGRPRSVAFWLLPLRERLWFPPGVGVACIARTQTKGGRPASLWLVLALRSTDVMTRRL